MVANLALDELPTMVRGIQSRGIVLPGTYYGALPAHVRSLAFTVSKLTQLAQIQRVLDTLDSAEKAGKSFADWKKDLLAAEPAALQLPPGRVETIFRNALMTEYSRGDEESAQQTKKTHPYAMYDAINDSVTRPSHLDMDGTIRPLDDPWWTTHKPPNGHNCRCGRILLSAAEAEARGITPNLPDATPDRGWDYSPGLEPTRGLQHTISNDLGKCPAVAEFAAQTRRELLIWCNAKARTVLSDLQQRLDTGTPLASLVDESVRGMNLDVAKLSRQIEADIGDLPRHVGLSVAAYGDYRTSRQMNRLLRYTASQSDALPQDWAITGPLIAGLMEFVERMPAKPGVVSRDIRSDKLPAGFIDAHREGQVVEYSAFTSTSAPPGASNLKSDLRVIIDQESARDVAGFTGFAEQQERLIPPNALFLVEQVSDGIIHLTEITRDQATGKTVHQFSSTPRKIRHGNFTDHIPPAELAEVAEQLGMTVDQAREHDVEASHHWHLWKNERQEFDPLPDGLRRRMTEEIQ